MSRMFDVLSSTVPTRTWVGANRGEPRASAEPVAPVTASRPEPAAPPRPATVTLGAPVPRPPDPTSTDDSEDTPFVEIGGPEGLVFSPGAAARIAPQPGPVTNPEPTPAADEEPVSIAPQPVPQPREFPRLAGVPRYLSVTFHNLASAPAPSAPADGPDPGLVAYYLPDHRISGEYRALRDEIRSQLPEPGPRVLLFTAATPRAGTTTVLLNLAVTLAREEMPRVLVVDANAPITAASAGVAQMMAAKPGPGLAEVLAQEVPLSWAVQLSPVSHLQLLTTGTTTAGRLATVGEDLPKLIGQLRQWYDWVLIDAGVWGAMPERDATCPAADAVYLVTREADVVRPEFAGLRGWVKELGGLLRGYITTRV